MPRIVTYILGPEFYWAFICLLVRAATKRGQAPTADVTSWLDDHWAWLPFILTPLTFVCLMLPETSRWWLLLRIDIAILIGLACATHLFVNGMVYHQPSSGPGAGSAYIAIPILGYFIAFVGTLITAAVFWWRSRGAA